jgi:hypothetical protein
VLPVLSALSAAQNRFTRTCQHYPSVTESSIPFSGILFPDDYRSAQHKI